MAAESHGDKSPAISGISVTSDSLRAGVPDDEQAKIAGGNTARVYNFDVARLTIPARSANLCGSTWRRPWTGAGRRG